MCFNWNNVGKSETIGNSGKLFYEPLVFSSSRATCERVDQKKCHQAYFCRSTFISLVSLEDDRDLWWSMCVHCTGDTGLA